MTTPQEYAFRFHEVTKRFGSVVANRAVSFGVPLNSIHGVVGENGAGKSTIMKVLYGMYPPDEGTIEIRGEQKRIENPQSAIRMGIGMVHQHFMLVPTLTVWQNVVLGKEPTLSKLNKPEILARLNAIQSEFGFNLDLDAPISTLPVGLQQQVEILKILYREADILILDEPTAVLTPQEVDLLFERLRTLQKRNKTIVIITHKLREILDFTESVTIMRQGSVVETVRTDTLNEAQLAEKIIGRHRESVTSELTHLSKSGNAHPLEIKGLTLRKGGDTLLNNLNFHVGAGEIVGIAGIEGNGQHELAEVIANVQRSYDGEVLFLNQPLKNKDTYEVKQQGLSIIPQDRHAEGLVLSFSVEENIILGHHKEEGIRKGIFLSKLSTSQLALKLQQEFDIRPANTKLPIAALSGGNQQKVIVARETSRPTKVLLASHPTRGVDIGAIDSIHSHFLALKKQGCAILLISPELEEILSLSDRILVIYQGRIIGETPRATATETQLGLWMTRGAQ